MHTMSVWTKLYEGDGIVMWKRRGVYEEEGDGKGRAIVGRVVRAYKDEGYEVRLTEDDNFTVEGES